MGGFGTGIILTAALAPLIGVKQVIPVLAVAGAIINGGRFWFYRHSFDRRALAPLIGVKQVIPVLAVAGAIINGGRFWFYRHSFDRRALALVLACALPFLVLGTWIYSVLEAR